MEYQRKRWDLYIKLAEESLASANDAVLKMKNNPDELAAESWETDTRREKDREKLEAQFKGSTDPKYREQLLRDFEKWQKADQIELENLRKSRP